MFAESETDFIVVMVKEWACCGALAFETCNRNHDGEFKAFRGVNRHDLHGVVIATFFDEVAVFIIGVFAVACERFQVPHEIFNGTVVIVKVFDGVIADLTESCQILQSGNFGQTFFDLRIAVNAFEHFGVTAFLRQFRPCV